jgi:predicted NBD/HSP70 family sugar kinase
LCTCGLRGCAETVLSGRGLIATTRELLLKRFPSSLDAETLTTNDILDAAFKSDPAALGAIEKMGEWLGVVMASASAWLNPARMIIGGGLGNAAFDLLLPPASETYAQRVLRGSQTGVQIVRSQVESSAVGAAALALNSV